MNLPINMKTKTRKKHQRDGGASKLCKSRTIKKIQQTREGMTAHSSHPIGQSEQKNQLHYHHRLFNAFECLVIPFLPNEPFDTNMEKLEMHFHQKTNLSCFSKIKRIQKLWQANRMKKKNCCQFFPWMPQLLLYI